MTIKAATMKITETKHNPVKNSVDQRGPGHTKDEDKNNLCYKVYQTFTKMYLIVLM